MKILSYSLLGLFAITSLVFANAPQTTVSSVWPTYQANAAHTGFAPLTLNPNSFHPIWQKQLINEPSSENLSVNTPITTNESLYVSTNCYSCQDNDLFDLSADTGTIKWHKTLGIDFSVNAPTYFGNRIYLQVTSDNLEDALRAYDAETGQIIYRAPFDSQYNRYSTPTVFNNDIYILAGTYGGIFSYDQHTGLINWFTDFSVYPGNIWSVSAYQDYLVTYFVPDETYQKNINHKHFISLPVNDVNTGSLFVFDRYHGNPLFSIKDPHYADKGGYYLAPVIDSKQQLVFLAFTGYLTAYNLLTQKIKYSIGTNFSGQPDLVNGVVYAKYGTNSIEAVDEETGQAKWTWSAGSDQLPAQYPFIVTNNILFVSGNNATYAVSLSTHKTVWSYRVSGQLAISQDRLFIINKDTTVYAISLV